VIAVAAFVVNALVQDPLSTGITFALIAAGIPVYAVVFARR